MKDIQGVLEQLTDDRVWTDGQKSSGRASNLQQVATFAPNLFVNISFDSTQWIPNLVHFYSSAVNVPLYQCITVQIHHQSHKNFFQNKIEIHRILRLHLLFREKFLIIYVDNDKQSCRHFSLSKLSFILFNIVE